MTREDELENQQLPLNYEFLGNVEVELEPPQRIGNKIIWSAKGGTFNGPKVSGKVLTTGGDWMISRPDGTLVLDARGTVETEDGALIYSYYNGYLVFTKEMYAMTPAEQAEVDPSKYYFRTTPRYETSEEKYRWLNNIIAVGIGRVREGGVFYSIYQIT